MLTKRTGSMRSRVGPAVTTTRRPWSAPLAGRSAATRSARSAGSSMRPTPVSPQAWSPTPGPKICTPRCTSVAMLARVAACAHMTWFIAGATASGACVARHRVASRSSAWPVASRARKSALAGAMSTASAQRASSMCPMAASAAASHRSCRTVRPETAWKVVAVTNSRAPAVITTCTSAPRARKRRTRSGLLYAAMPPVTPSRMCLPSMGQLSHPATPAGRGVSLTPNRPIRGALSPSPRGRDSS